MKNLFKQFLYLIVLSYAVYGGMTGELQNGVPLIMILAVIILQRLDEL